MSIQIYKEGTDVTVKGVECDFKNINIGELNHYLEQGWFKSPGEWIEPTEEDLKAAEEREAAEKKAVAEEHVKAVRKAAKTAGIAGWDKKKIKQLESELNDLQNKGD